MKKFYLPDLSDSRMLFAESELENIGYTSVKEAEKADFILVAPGNKEYQSNPSVLNYFNDEEFLIKNAFLTAECAVGLAILNSEGSVADSNVLILGFGRIAKGLLKYLSSFTNNITVCARNETARAEAQGMGAEVCDFEHLKELYGFEYIFNTIPFPVMSKNELSRLKKECVLIELASLPGGIDKHYAGLCGLNYIAGGRLPARFAPRKAGGLVAHAADKIIKEGRI